MNLLDLTTSEMTNLMLQLNEKKYRATQLMKWLSAGSRFDEMTNIPDSLKNKLKELGYI